MRLNRAARRHSSCFFVDWKPVCLKWRRPRRLRRHVGSSISPQLSAQGHKATVDLTVKTIEEFQDAPVTRTIHLELPIEMFGNLDRSWRELGFSSLEDFLLEAAEFFEDHYHHTVGMDL